jgi:hypothetical protein
LRSSTWANTILDAFVQYRTHLVLAAAPLILELCERENGAEAIFGAEISGFTVLQTALQ